MATLQACSHLAMVVLMACTQCRMEVAMDMVATSMVLMARSCLARNRMTLARNGGARENAAKTRTETEIEIEIEIDIKVNVDGGGVRKARAVPLHLRHLRPVIVIARALPPRVPKVARAAKVIVKRAGVEAKAEIRSAGERKTVRERNLLDWIIQFALVPSVLDLA